MPEMILFSCHVALGGDQRNQVPPADRGWGQGVVSGPEIEVLVAGHGQGSVIDPVPVLKTETTPRAEKARLAAIYTVPVVEKVFPGQNPQMNLKPSMDDLNEVIFGPAHGEDDDPEAVRPAAPLAEPLSAGEATELVKPATKREPRKGASKPALSPVAQKAARIGGQVGDTPALSRATASPAASQAPGSAVIE